MNLGILASRITWQFGLLDRNTPTKKQKEDYSPTSTVGDLKTTKDIGYSTRA